MTTAANDFAGQVRQEMRSNCFNNILTALNVSDNLHIIFAMLEVIEDFIYFGHVMAETPSQVILTSRLSQSVTQLIGNATVLFCNS